MRIIALINQKGGCGKTTTAVNLSAALAEQGKKVLLIDLDPQGHASLALGVSPEETPSGMASVLAQELSLDEIVIRERFPGLDLAPSNLRLAALEQKLSGVPQREERLLGALRGLQRSYDLIFIDAPPSLGLLSFNALRVADEVLVPIDPGVFSFHGLGRLRETLDLLQTHTGQTIGVWGLATLASRTRFAQEMIELLDGYFSENIRKRFPGGRYRTIIRNNVRLREAAYRGIPVMEHDPAAIGAEDYRALAQEILQREEETVRAVRETAEEAAPGPLRVGEGALFTWIGSGEMAVAGEFNDWVPDRKVYALPAGGDRVRKWLPSAPARFAYRLRIGGVWRGDPFNPRIVEHPIGGRSSLLESADPSPFAEERPPIGIEKGHPA